MMGRRLLEKGRERTLEALEISREEEEKGLELHNKSLVFDSLCSAGPEPLSAAQRREIDRGLEADEAGTEIVQRVLKMESFQSLIHDSD